MSAREPEGQIGTEEQGVSYWRLAENDDAVAHWPLTRDKGPLAIDRVGGNHGVYSGYSRWRVALARLAQRARFWRR